MRHRDRAGRVVHPSGASSCFLCGVEILLKRGTDTCSALAETTTRCHILRVMMHVAELGMSWLSHDEQLLGLHLLDVVLLPWLDEGLHRVLHFRFEIIIGDENAAWDTIRQLELKREAVLTGLDHTVCESEQGKPSVEYLMLALSLHTHLLRLSVMFGFSLVLVPLGLFLALDL